MADVLVRVACYKNGSSFSIKMFGLTRELHGKLDSAPLLFRAIFGLTTLRILHHVAIMRTVICYGYCICLSTFRMAAAVRQFKYFGYPKAQQRRTYLSTFLKNPGLAIIPPNW